MAKVKIQQVRSIIKATKNQKLTMQALGLKKMGQTVEHEANPQILGMLEKVKHLTQVVK